MMPNAAMIHSAELGAHTATRSPLRMPQLGERTRGVADAFDEFDEGQAQRTVDDRLGVAEPVRRAQDHLGDGLPGGGHLASRGWVKP